MPANQFPKDFADAVCTELRKRVSYCPQPEILVDLFETMYFASLTTEESQPVVFNIVYLDPNNHDPDRPGWVFQASIAGVGHLVAYIGLWKIAELKTNTILRQALNVLEGGPVRETLGMGIQSYIEGVKREIPEYMYRDRNH